MKRSLSLAALTLAAVLALPACGTDSGDTSSGGTSSSGTTSTEAAASASGADAEASTSGDAVSEEHNHADVMFAQLMIPHHQQAVRMSEMMLAKDGISPGITDLATKIKDAQGPEIETMTGWLDAWGEPLEPEGGMDGHDMGDMGSEADSMEGMMSEDQMADLESAEGTEASRMFLESMTAHHEGAVDMARTEIDDGENPEAVELAGMIVETQNAEIEAMRELLVGL
ncbi:DUF305 domain-containing protein [Arthrobacter agilis]|uniref:DUF305 domain-containing protein n=1 Tax=Arthrobacter agilis TaxID=37921 RepID=UPI000B34C54D|nr:DUF305 domain-containing protein [Arthrobacter agilis]OUM41462.1 DUF305 domain-containing protein [Arthrobacter agilis]PPB46207.1 DUF305 domain-containing protein [Arthrobacter agilis]TPV26962.1 DUF305 domain-containing protein [Arthrobacter agilis]VDR32904.1 Uncharacterized protein conserved in bacteria [Arthrobacter agilis]